MAFEPFYTRSSPSCARTVLVATRNVNAISTISIVIKHDLGLHAYTMRQSSEGNGTISKMYKMNIPLGFLTLYLTENVRITKSYRQMSATVTAGRNYAGDFPEALRYVLDYFYQAVKTYYLSNNMTTPMDHFLHLHQGFANSMPGHAGCMTSMSFMLKYHKNEAQINRIVAQCLATDRILYRRYPANWSFYYIQLALVEYYTITGSTPNTNLEFADRTMLALRWDDTLRNSITIRRRLNKAEPGDFEAINVHRGMSMSMVRQVFGKC